MIKVDVRTMFPATVGAEEVKNQIATLIEQIKKAADDFAADRVDRRTYLKDASGETVGDVEFFRA